MKTKTHQIKNIEKPESAADVMKRQAEIHNKRKIGNSLAAGLFILIGIANLLGALPFEDGFDYVQLAIALANLGFSSVWIKNAIKASKNQKIFTALSKSSKNTESPEQSAPQA